jgi:transcriptional regulator with XRE-family HTH domain
MLLKTNEEILRDLGQRARRMRLERRISQVELAERAGVHVNTVRSFERGEDIRLRMLIGILRALGQVEDIESILTKQTPTQLDAPSEPLPQRIRKKA